MYYSQRPCCTYRTCENFGRGKLGNREPFAKIFLANIHRYMKNVYGICTDCCLFTKFFLANSYLLPAWFAKIFPTKYFPCTVLEVEPCSNTVYKKTLAGDYWQIWRIVELFAKIFLANGFYLYGLPKFSLTKYFLNIFCNKLD